jgi:hypothetical protein
MRLNSSEKVFHVLYDEVIEPNCQRAGEVVSKGAMTMHSITQKQQHYQHPCCAKYEQRGALLGPTRKARV